MSASLNDVAFGCDVVPAAQWANITSLRPTGATSLRTKRVDRIIHPENPKKDSPRVNTLEDLCEVLGVELWEIFYLGDRSFVALQTEIATLKSERDALVVENAVLKEKIDTLKDKVDALKDDIIATHNFFNKLKQSS